MSALFLYHLGLKTIPQRHGKVEALPSNPEMIVSPLKAISAPGEQLSSPNPGLPTCLLFSFRVFSCVDDITGARTL